MIHNLKALGLALVAVLAMSAMAASAASANPADFAASSYPAHVVANGVGKQSFKTSEGTELTCVGVEAEEKPPVTGTGILNEQSESLTVEAPEGKGTEMFHGCHATILKIPVTVHMNGCKFTFNAGKLVSDESGTTAETGNTATGSVSIVGCEDKTKGITITVGENGKTCHIDVPEQKQVSGSVHYTTITEGGVEHVQVNVKNVVVNIDTTGGTACSGSTESAVAATSTYNGIQEATATEGKSLTIAGTKP